jgi:GNAT superfamily N-acetyltransferase
MSSGLVRGATLEDAAAAVAVVRASISELCVADHKNDPATLERWLSNKNVECFRSWLSDPRSFLVVADVRGEISGVACLHAAGNVHLCYVLPGRQRGGVSAAMLRELEAQATRWGLAELRLTSTVGARAFYERHGYAAIGDAVPAFGVLWHYPYSKSLGV